MTNDEKGNVLVSKSSTQLRGCDESDSADRNMQAIEWSVNSDGGEISHKALESAKEFYRDVKDCIGDSPNLSSLASASGWLPVSARFRQGEHCSNRRDQRGAQDGISRPPAKAVRCCEGFYENMVGELRFYAEGRLERNQGRAFAVSSSDEVIECA